METVFVNNFRRPCPNVWLIAGTRPEAVKLAPVAQALHRAGRMRPSIVASGQHPAMVHQALASFEFSAERELAVRRVAGGQPELLAGLITSLDRCAESAPPAAVVVQGDTTTALAGALVGFWRRIPVVHLEAGLRSFDLGAPFPEELNRRLVTQATSLHLAPTRVAAGNLLAEGVDPGRVFISGNTVVDAVNVVANRPTRFTHPEVGVAVERAARGEQRLVLVTAHRRESWGEPMRQILAAIHDLVRSHSDIQVVLPAHPNPAVRDMVLTAFADHPSVLVTDPLPYEELASVLAASTLVLSDSGGIQEEAPTFGVPVLVLRDVTERGEAVDAGCALLVGTDRARIVESASRLLVDSHARVAMMSAGNPFGDGRAGERTEAALAWLLGLVAELPDAFEPAGRGAANGSTVGECS